MAGYLRVRELGRDEELGVIKKQVNLPGGGAFESPSRSVARARGDESAKVSVNEVPRLINEGTIASLESGTSTLTRDIRNMFIPDALNLAIFDLKFDNIPTASAVRTIAQYLYSSSDRVVMLPTVKSGLLKEPPKFARYSETRIGNYVQMMSHIIEQIETLGNSKAIIGTIPLMPIKFSRQILELYFAKGIEAFAIDASTKDIIINEADFRLILAEINSHKSLGEVFLYACNLGYPLFEKNRTRADDFLSIFAYIDVLGGTFKTRGGPMGFRGLPKPPRAKLFSREQYSYEIADYHEVSRKLGRRVSSTQLQNYNQRLQLLEASQVRGLIGQERVKKYVQTKPAVDELSMKRLESIAKGVSLK
jgi:predicted DNA-binding protein YlxM (UPF0122 family)